MKYITDIKEGDVVVGHYYCKDKQTQKSRAGKTYLSLCLSDKTGIIDGKVWDLNNNIQSFEAGSFIKVEAFASQYLGEIQLKITKIRKSMEGEYFESDYIPVTDRNVDAMFNEFTSYIQTISCPYIRTLLENVFTASGEVARCFKLSSAAKTLHHGYIGGLLEHTLSVVKICDFMSVQYRYINRDILIAAAMLHDVAKIWELKGFPENDYTDAGQLLGHIFLGAELIGREAAKIEGFPENTELLLKHCILAHHGDYEFGSPKLPCIIEALVLYICDNMDAKIFYFHDIIEKDKTNNKWVGYNKMLQRSIRRTE